MDVSRCLSDRSMSVCHLLSACDTCPAASQCRSEIYCPSWIHCPFLSLCPPVRQCPYCSLFPDLRYFIAYIIALVLRYINAYKSFNGLFGEKRLRCLWFIKIFIVCPLTKDKLIDYLNDVACSRVLHFWQMFKPIKSIFVVIFLRQVIMNYARRPWVRGCLCLLVIILKFSSSQIFIVSLIISLQNCHVVKWTEGRWQKVRVPLDYMRHQLQIYDLGTKKVVNVMSNSAKWIACQINPTDPMHKMF